MRETYSYFLFLGLGFLLGYWQDSIELMILISVVVLMYMIIDFSNFNKNHLDESLGDLFKSLSRRSDQLDEQIEELKEHISRLESSKKR